MRARRRRATSWGSSCVATASRPGLASPTALSMPPRNSATRGAGWPRRGSGVTALLTTPPSASRSITPATSHPNPAVPARRRTGFWKVVPRRAMSLTGGPPAARRGAERRVARGAAGPLPAADRAPARAGRAGGGRRAPPRPRRGRRARVRASAPTNLPPPHRRDSARRAGRECTGTSGRRHRAPAAANRRRRGRAPGRRRVPWARRAIREPRAHGADARALAFAAVGNEAGYGLIARRGSGDRSGREQAVAVREQEPRPRPGPQRLDGDEALYRHRRGLRADSRGQCVEDGKPGGFIGAAFQATAHEPRDIGPAAPGNERLRLDRPGHGLLRARQERARSVRVSPRQGGESREVRGARAASPVG